MSNHRHPASIGIALCFVVASGCGAPPAASTPAHDAPPPSSPSAPSTSPARAPAIQHGAPSAEPAEPTEPALGPSPLHVVGEHDSPLALFDLGKVGFVLASGKVFEVRDDDVAYSRSPNSGLPSGEAYETVRLAGEWPDTAFVVATRTDSNRRRTELFFWDGRRWKSKLQTRKSTVISTLSPWNLRRVLALLKHVGKTKHSFRVVAGFPIAPVPQPTKSSTTDCETEVLAQVASIARSGHVFTAGPRCAAGPAAAAVEHWKPSEKAGEIQNLPQSSGVEMTAIVARDPSTVFVAGASENNERPAYMAVFDGEAWQRSDVPMRSGISQLVADPEGTLWAVTRQGTLWKTPDGATWTQVPMPPAPGEQGRVQAVRVWSKAAGDTWVIGRHASQDGSQRWMLLHSRPHEGSFSFEAPAPS